MIKSIGPEWADYIAKHQAMYPEVMHEEQATFDRLLKGGLCWGSFARDILCGWILFEEQLLPADMISRFVYCYDVAVLAEYQRGGIMKRLAAHAYTELRWKSLVIRMHCRRASYPSPAFLYRYGYEIIRDRLILNHYGKEYETDKLIEDAHELWLAPIGQ